MAIDQRKVGQDKSVIVAELPRACMDETAAVEFMENKRWGEQPFCPRCGCTSVYKMVDAKSGERSKRYLWRCKDCKRQFTVRIGTVFEESRIPLKHWCYGFWRASTSKKGASALEIKRHTGLTYKSALFMMHRIRYAMTDDAPPDKLKGIIEIDETYVGGKPKPYTGKSGKGTLKTPVVALVQREGNVRARVMPTVNSKNLREAIDESVDCKRSVLMTDESPLYSQPGKKFLFGHETVNHRRKEYARDGFAHCNTAESFFALIKRGMYGVYHNVSKKHLHRYVNEFAFRWNGRKLEDGERTIAAIRGAEGKRLYYKPPAA